VTDDLGLRLARALDRAAGDLRGGAEQAARRLGIEGFIRRSTEGDLGEAPAPSDRGPQVPVQAQPPNPGGARKPARAADHSARIVGTALASRLYETTLLEAAAQVSAALAKRGIPHFVAKGVSFLGVLYEPGDREVADVDLWVKSDGVGAAHDALADLGFTEAAARQQGGPAGLRPGRLFVNGGSPTALTAVAVDLHWVLEPLNRIIPRPGPPLPEEVWSSLDRSGPFPVPDASHHVALLIHHLAHHDLLHVRGLLDLALLWRRGPIARDRFERTARHLGVWRLARVIAQMLVRDLGVSPAAEIPAPPRDWRGRRLARLLALNAWLTLALRAPEVEHYEITVGRLARRYLMLDRARDAIGLVSDAIWPPAAHVRWRWPESSGMLSARWQHTRHALGKLSRSAIRAPNLD
jgi:hypothetical protein